MPNISIQQARARFQKISEPLQDAIFSVQTAEITRQICEQNHIGEDKMSEVGRVTGLVLLGFVHPEDMASEISERIGISFQAAKAISANFIPRLFDPLKADLDKAYAPLSHEDQSVAPKIIQEVKPSQAVPKSITVPAPKPPAPQIISQSFSASPNVGATPLTSNRNTPAAAPSPAPNKPTDSDKGWSTRTPQNPVVTLGAITPAVPSPATTPTIDLSQRTKPGSAATTAGGAKGMSEFDRLDMMKKNTAASTPTTGQTQAMPKPPTPAPVMLHEISASSAQTPEFRVNVGMQNQMGGNASRSSMPSKPAVLEFGGATTTPAQTAPKAVHYSEYKAPTPTAPSSANDGAPRQITEITKPATPPAPTTPPNKVIVQDFLG